MVATIDEQQTKALLKDVLVELITEKQDEFSAIILEAFEEAALASEKDDKTSSSMKRKSSRF